MIAFGAPAAAGAGVPGEAGAGAAGVGSGIGSGSAAAGNPKPTEPAQPATIRAATPIRSAVPAVFLEPITKQPPWPNDAFLTCTPAESPTQSRRRTRPAYPRACW